jgi:hypothetical protein
MPKQFALRVQKSIRSHSDWIARYGAPGSKFPTRGRALPTVEAPARPTRAPTSDQLYERGIRQELRIGREQMQRLADRLCDQNSIKRIPM